MDFQNNNLWIGGNFAWAGGKRSDKIAGYSIEGVPSVEITSVTSSGCTGDTLLFQASGYNLGTNPTYQWLANNNPIGNNSSTLQSSILTNGTVLTLMIITDPSCGNGDTIYSTPITLFLTPLQAPLINQSNNNYTITNPDALATYTWQLDNSGTWGNIIPTVTGNSYNAINAGLYRVRGEKGSCTRYSQTLVSTSVNELANDFNLQINPNPAHELLNIQCSKNINTFELVDITGKLILMENQLSKDNISIDLSGISPGIYFVRITDLNKSVATRRFVKE
jgi:hypothetical protein